MQPTKQNNYQGHRIWYFIDQAKKNKKDSINFYRPVSTLANMRYTDLSDLLTQKGYLVAGLSSPKGSTVGVLQISGIMGV